MARSRLARPWAAARPAAGRTSACCAPERGRHLSRHHRRHLDRRRRRRLLRGRRARRAGALRPRPDARRMLRLPRFQFLRLRPDHRPAPVRRARQRISSITIEDLTSASSRSRPRSAPATRSGCRAGSLVDRHARLLRAARHLPPGADRRPLAVRRRAGQSDSGLGVPRARRAHRHRRQPQQRRVRPRQPWSTTRNAYRHARRRTPVRRTRAAWRATAAP